MENNLRLIVYASKPQKTTAFCACPLGNPGLDGGQYTLSSRAIPSAKFKGLGRGLLKANLIISLKTVENKNDNPTIVASRLLTHQKRNGINRM